MAEWLSLAEAIAANVRDGDCVALEGFTHLIPFAAGHEIIRQGRRNLSLVRMTPDLIYDQLIGAGCAAKLTFSWGGNPGVGSMHRFETLWRRAGRYLWNCRSAATVIWRMHLRRAHPDFRLNSCVDTRAAICLL